MAPPTSTVTPMDASVTLSKRMQNSAARLRSSRSLCRAPTSAARAAVFMLRFLKRARFVERSWAIERKWLAARADSILLRNGEQEVKPLAEPTPMDVGGSADRAAPTEESSAAPIAPAGQGAGHVSELEGWALGGAR